MGSQAAEAGAFQRWVPLDLCISGNGKEPWAAKNDCTHHRKQRVVIWVILAVVGAQACYSQQCPDLSPSSRQRSFRNHKVKLISSPLRICCDRTIAYASVEHALHKFRRLPAQRPARCSFIHAPSAGSRTELQLPSLRP